MQVASEVAASKRKLVAIYGGAFNPPTNAHLMLSTEIVRSGHVDEVWLCPSGPRPDKPDMASPSDRLIMCEIAVNTCLSPAFPVKVIDQEVKKDRPSPTYETLSALREAHADCDFAFVVGTDWLRPGTDLRKWDNGEKLIEEFDFLVLRRPGYEVEDLESFGPRFKYLQLANGYNYLESNVSSTEVRKRAKTSWAQDSRSNLFDLDGIVAPGVLAFIMRHGLYKSF